jgi:hypothetical protein
MSKYVCVRRIVFQISVFGNRAWGWVLEKWILRKILDLRVVKQQEDEEEVA